MCWNLSDSHFWDTFDHVFNAYVQSIPSGSNGTSPAKPCKEDSNFLQSLMESDELLDFTVVFRSRTSTSAEWDGQVSCWTYWFGGRWVNSGTLWSTLMLNCQMHCSSAPDRFPIISRIASNFPVSEWLFSKSQHLCVDLWSLMKAEAMPTAAMEAKLWTFG